MWEWEFIVDNESPPPPPPPPPTEEEFITEVTQVLTENGATGALDTDELELLSQDEWEEFVLALLGFFTDNGPQGADQNSYYDDHSNEAPLGQAFLDAWGWLPSVQNLPGYHYFDYLESDIDSELMGATIVVHEMEHELSMGGASLADIEGMPFAVFYNGQLITFSWHSGTAPSSGGSTDDDTIVVTASVGYWTCNFQPMQDQNDWTDTPIASDFIHDMTIADWPFAVQVNEALQYLAHSPTALALLRAARLNGVTIVMTDQSESFTAGSVVFWNPTSGLMINGQLMSPAMVLLHEIGHALNAALRIPLLSDPQYDNSGERHVIVDIESVVARELGEPTRTSHSGPEVVVVYTPGVTDHTPQPPAPPE